MNPLTTDSMNTEVVALILLALFTLLLVCIVVCHWLKTETRDEVIPAPKSPPVPDPAVPEIPAQAVDRLLDLPHFHRLPSGALFDHYRGTLLETCDCRQFHYPHLTLYYGAQRTLAFETARALDRYVAVQEAVAGLLPLGGDHLSQSIGEEH